LLLPRRGKPTVHASLSLSSEKLPSVGGDLGLLVASPFFDGGECFECSDFFECVNSC
jgi:hypothetical protein